MIGPSERVKHLASYLVGLNLELGPAADEDLKQRIVQQAIQFSVQWYLSHLQGMSEITLAHLQSLSIDLDYLESLLKQHYNLVDMAELRQSVALILTPGAEQEFFTSQRATKWNAIQVEHLVPLIRKLRGGDPQRIHTLNDLADLLSAE